MAAGKPSPHRHLGARIAALWALLAAFACDGAPTPDAGGGGAVLFERDTPRYRLAVDRAGDAEVLRYRVEPHGIFHLSTEFPSKLELTGTGVRLATTRFARADASELTEETVAFSVPFSDEGAGEPGGPTRIAGAFTFGLCEGEELCERITERFDVALD